MISTRKLFKNKLTDGALKYGAIGAGIGALGFGVYQNLRGGDHISSSTMVDELSNTQKQIAHYEAELTQKQILLRKHNAAVSQSGNVGVYHPDVLPEGKQDSLKNEVDKLNHKLTKLRIVESQLNKTKSMASQIRR